MTPQTVDLRIDADWIIPVVPRGAALTDHSLLVHAGRIVALVARAQAQAAYVATRHLRLHGHALLPGLVNAHTHAAMTLLRGYADDLPLMTWLNEHIWPAEARHANAEFVRDGTRLACLEMLRGGVTCCNDMYFFAEATLEAAGEAGMRLVAGLILLDFPTAYAADADDYLAKGLALRDAWLDRPLAHFALAPHAPYTVGDRGLERIATYAAQLDLPVHMHIHETEDELRHGQQHYGARPLARLHGLGLLGPNLIAVHAVHLNEDEITLLARQGCHVVHCPASNLKLASGFAPVARLLATGVNVAIGTDGAASNNRLDLLSETRLAALLGKGVANDPAALPAAQALEMATLAGARALGLDGVIGSLEPGKSADIIAIDLDHPATQPCHDPIAQIVYSAGCEQVRRVWVAGREVVADGHCRSLDEAAVLRRARVWRERLART